MYHEPDREHGRDGRTELRVTLHANRGRGGCTRGAPQEQTCLYKLQSRLHTAVPRSILSLPLARVERVQDVLVEFSTIW